MSLSIQHSKYHTLVWNDQQSQIIIYSAKKKGRGEPLPYYMNVDAKLEANFNFSSRVVLSITVGAACCCVSVICRGSFKEATYARSDCVRQTKCVG